MVERSSMFYDSFKVAVHSVARFKNICCFVVEGGRKNVRILKTKFYIGVMESVFFRVGAWINAGLTDGSAGWGLAIM